MLNDCEFINKFQPERDGLSCFNATVELDEGGGTKNPATSTLSLVFYWLHATMIAVIHLRKQIYLYSNKFFVGINLVN